MHLDQIANHLPARKRASSERQCRAELPKQETRATVRVVLIFFRGRKKFFKNFRIILSKA